MNQYVVIIIFLSLIKCQEFNEVNNITRKNASFPFYGEMFTGFITVENTTGAKLYYHLFAANATNLSANAPLTIWLQGGPGCSSNDGNYDEIGPVFIVGNSTAWEFVPNPYTWNQWSHLMFIDQPTGTGFSPSNGFNISTTWQAGEQFAVFMARFYQLFPVLQDKGLYLFGESYAGKYIPVFSYILQKNETFRNMVEIKGIGIGDGWSNPIVQTKTSSTLGYAAGCLGKLEAFQLRMQENEAFIAMNNSEWYQGTFLTDAVSENLNIDCGGTNYYDYRQFSSDFSEYEYWLNTSYAQEFLGIPETIYVDCNSEVSEDMFDDQSQSIAWVYPYLMSQFRVLFYNGQDDNNCDYEGVSNYINQLDWPGIKNFRKSARVPWYFPNGTVAGLVKAYENVTFAVVNKAGHMAPVYQPESTGIMFRNFVNNQPLNEPFNL